MLLWTEFWNESYLALGAEYDIISMFHFGDEFRPFPFIHSLERNTTDSFAVYSDKSTTTRLAAKEMFNIQPNRLSCQIFSLGKYSCTLAV